MSGTARGSRVGSQFGHYHLKRLLGRGGMGEVYEAEDSVRERVVALKLLSVALSEDPVFRERLQREARTAGRLQEPHVVPVHDFGEIDGQLFLDMRLIQGSDLAAILKKTGPLTPSRAVNIVSQAASALDAAHAVGVIHRDIKPENILVSRDDFSYLCDFGIASATTDERLTQMGSAVGTWKYSAPERFTGDEVTQSVDVYALACVLFECLTGVPPYRADNPGALITAQLMEPIPAPSQLAPGIPSGFDAVVARGMAKDPKDRYDSAGDLARAAFQALSSPPGRERAIEAPARPPEPRTATPTPPPMAITPRPADGRTPPPGFSTSHPGVSTSHPGVSTSHPGVSTSHPGVSTSHPGVSAPRPGVGAPRPGVTPPPMNITPHPPGAGPHPGGPHFGGGSWPDFQSAVRPHGRPTRPQPGNMKLRIGAIAAAVVLVVLTIWLIARPSHEEPTPEVGAEETTTTPVPTMPPADVQARLFKLVPAGYAPNACKAVLPPAGTVAKVFCSQNADPGGPSSASYTLFPDEDALHTDFDKMVDTSAVAVCPGGVQSPGAWHRAATPDKPSGTVMCGSRQDHPTVAWTNDADLLIAVVQGAPNGPNLDQLFLWWSSHS